MSEVVTARGYLVIQGDRTNWGGLRDSARINRTTVGFPQMTGDQVAVRVTVKIPKSAFAPVAEVEIEVPEELVSAPEVSVTPG